MKTSTPFFTVAYLYNFKNNYDSYDTHTSKSDLNQTTYISHMSTTCLETYFPFPHIISLCLPILSQDHPGNSILETAKYAHLSPEPHTTKIYPYQLYTCSNAAIYSKASYKKYFGKMNNQRSIL